MEKKQQLSQAIATVERQISEAKSETAKKALTAKLGRLKEDLRAEKSGGVSSLTTLSQARKVVKALDKTAFEKLVEKLSEKPEYAFLKDYSQDRLRRDALRTAKPRGYRFKGDSNAKPTIAQIKKGLKDGTVYYEGRPIRSDVNSKVRLAKGGHVSKGEMVWNKLSKAERLDFLYENFTPQITPITQEAIQHKRYVFLPKNVKIVLESKYANVEEYAKGGGVGSQKKYEIELFFAGLSGEERKIGKYVVSERTLDKLEDEYSGNIEFDVLNETESKAQTFESVNNDIIEKAKSRLGTGKMAKGGGVSKRKTKGDVGKSGTQYAYTLEEYELAGEKYGLFVSPSEFWKSQEGTKYEDSFGRTQTTGERDKEQVMMGYGYRIAIGLDLGSKKIPASAKKYVEENNLSKYGQGGNVDSDISKYKKQLIAKAKDKGLYENFGQDEVRKLEDKYGYTDEVRAFDNWAMNFDLSSLRQYGQGGNIEFRSLAKSNNFDIIVPEGRFEVELDSNKKVKSIVHPSGERHQANECPIYQKYKKEIKEYLTERFKDGGSIGFIPMDLENDLAITAQWGGTNVNGVIGILNAMIDSGITDEDLKPRPAKNTTFQYKRAVEKNIQEIWKKIQPKYKGDFKGNMYYSTIKRLVERSDRGDDILKKFKPFRKNQKDEFFKQTEYKVFNFTDKIYATDETFKTEESAEKFIKEFRKRYEKQGYYRDNEGNKINPNEIGLKTIESDFNPYTMFKDARVKDLVKIKLYDSVIYKDNLYSVAEKEGVLGISYSQPGAWGLDAPFIPLSKIDMEKITDMYGNKVSFDELRPKTTPPKDSTSTDSMPTDLKEDLRILAKWGDTTIEGAIEYLNAFTDAGITNEDLEVYPTKNTRFQREKATEKKIKEIWSKVEPFYAGSKGNYSDYRLTKELVERPYDILRKFKEYRKNQKFADGGSVGSYTYLPKSDISKIVLKSKQVIGKDRILDGAYIKEKLLKGTKSSKATKISKSAEQVYNDLINYVKETYPKLKFGENKDYYFTESMIQELIDANYSEREIKGFVLGLNNIIKVDSDNEFIYLDGLQKYGDEYKQKYINLAVEASKNNAFELGLKYPNFNWKQIITKYKIDLNPVLITRKREHKSGEYDVYTIVCFVGKDIVIGGTAKREHFKDGKLDYETEERNPSEIKGQFNEGYWGIVSSKKQVIVDVAEMLLSQKEGYVKEMDFLINDLGGVGSEELVANKIKFAKGGNISNESKNLSSMTGARAEAIESFFNENGLDHMGRLKVTMGVGRGHLSRKDFATAIAGERGNKYAKEIIDYVKTDRAFKMAKGGNLGYTYIPNEDIEKIIGTDGTEYGEKVILDGAYVTDKVRTPKMSRTQFEEDVYAYGDGGNLEENYDFLVGEWVAIHILGVEEPILRTIKSVSITPKNFSNRDLIIGFSSEFEESIPLNKVAEFLRGSVIELKNSKGERYGLELLDVDSNKMSKGGNTGYTYVPNADIEKIIAKDGKEYGQKVLLDGAYVTDKIRTPKMSRTQFEEDVYAYGEGGGISKSGSKIYKLRAEGLNDFLAFLQNGMYFKVKSFTVEPLGIPDVVVTFETDSSLSEIKEKLREIPDSHVMLDTVKPINEYTGDREEEGEYAHGGSMYATGGGINVSDIKKEKQKMLSELFEKCGVFFAFSDKQFEENKTPLKEGEKYVSIGGGGYLPKGKVKEFQDGMEAIERYGKEKVKKNNLAESEILDELQNHECFYTGDISDVVDLFEGTYTVKQIRDVYNKYREENQEYATGGGIGAERVIGKTTTGKSIYQKYNSIPDLSYEELKEASDIFKKFSKKAKSEEEKQMAINYSVAFMRMANEEKFAKGLGKYATGGEITPEEREQALKNYPTLNL